MSVPDSVPPAPASGPSSKFGPAVFIFQVILIILYATLVDYDVELAGPNDAVLGKDVTKYYSVFQDVHVMIFIGFAYLMAFLGKYGFGAVGYNFLIGALAIQWGMLLVGLFDHAHTGHSGAIKLSIKMLIEGDFAAGAVLITFGAMLGKTSPLQMVAIVFFELIFYNINFFIGALKLQAVDMGGSMFVHSFGAYFGLACAWVLGRGRQSEFKDHANNGSSKTTDTFAMIGTIFLWMFWPSFNGALADYTSQHRVIVNTVVSLCGSCVGAFAMSQLRRKKFSMVDIQNATLAGGVAVGSAADLVIRPWAAMTVGFVASIVSVWGYTWLQRRLERWIGLFDTCGVHNLHGMPGLIGGIAGSISAAACSTTLYGHNIGEVYPARLPVAEGGEDRDAGKQALYQFLALLVTVGIAISSGLLTGLIVRLRVFEPPTCTKALFRDHLDWLDVEDSDEEAEGEKA